MTSRGPRSLATAAAACATVVLGACSAAPSPVPRHPRGPCELTIRIRDLVPARGSGPVAIAVWSSPTAFMRHGEWYETRSVAAERVGEPVVIDGLEEGTYAISAFHDVTSCGELRRNVLGIPVDPWAVSGIPSPLAPPSWKRSAIRVMPGANEVDLVFVGGRKVP